MKGYLILYNLISTLGWAWVFLQSLSIHAIYPIVWKQVLVVQSFAILEILHAGLGLVKSSVLTNVIQMGTRLQIVWFICFYLGNESIHDSVAYGFMVLAWSLSDIIRLVYYNIGLFGYKSAWMTWARYSLFIILYPIGALGEVILMIKGLPSIHALSVGLYYGFLVLLLIYPFGFAYMYNHMWMQRKKYLNPAQKMTKKKT